MATTTQTRLDCGLDAAVLAAHGQTATILPEMGFNLYSWTAHGRELMMTPPDILHKGCTYGFPILFPTPNRVPDGRYIFEGKTHQQAKGGVPRLIHGLAYDERFAVECGVSGDDAWARGSLRIAPGDELYEAFPFTCTLYVTYTLTEDGLRLDYLVENDGDGPVPFGFAVHPYFSKMDQPDAIFVRHPLTEGYEAVEAFPTGRILDYAGTERDLREGAAVSANYVDQIYYGMSSEKTTQIEYRDWGVTMTIRASDDFVALIVYEPPQLPGFCIENQTCSTNAHNFHAQGLVKEANLIILEPGTVHRGWITYALEVIP